MDVFETCLLRDVGAGDNVWQIVWRELLRRGAISGVPEAAFAELRRRAADEARVTLCREDAPLELVYQQLGRSFGWDLDACRDAAQQEAAVEASVARANPLALEFVTQGAWDDLCYVSDTPLGASEVGAMLSRCGFPRGRVLTSGDEGALKATGNLLRVAAGRAGEPLRQLVHAGNDPASDGTGSFRAGARYVQLADGNPNRYERALDSPSTRALGLLGPCLAGASRRQRLALDGRVEPGLLSVECGVAGPFVFCAALWALLMAEHDGVDRLYFAARDGEVLLRAAHVARRHLGVGASVEPRYLYGSRRAWQLAASARLGWREARLLVIDADPEGCSLESTLRILEPDPDELGAVAEEVLGSRGDPRAPLGTRAAGDAIRRLQESSAVEGLWARRAEAACETTMGYLAQEGLLGARSPGIVDIGWLGRAAGALASLAASRGVRVRPYFAGGLSGPDAGASTPGSRTFLVDERSCVSSDRPGLVHLLEAFCSGREGTTLGYRLEGDRYVPRLAAERNDPALEWGLEAFQDRLVEYCEAACEHLRTAGETPALTAVAGLSHALRENVHQLWAAPSPAEVVAWASFPFESPGARTRPLAALPRRAVVLAGPRRWPGMFGPWPAGKTGLALRALGATRLGPGARTAWPTAREGVRYVAVRTVVKWRAWRGARALSSWRGARRTE
jgi:hypothetical protein